MSLRTCADCSTQYALDIDACPHCGSSNTTKDGVVNQRFPLFVTLSCTSCGRGPWTVRLTAVTTGLIDLPTLACASCGSRVPVTWPPEEEPMSPKITVHGGATNAHGADVSPVADVSQPQVGAEADLGRPTSSLDEVQVETEPEEDAAVETKSDEPDYESLSLGELREAAAARDLPTYGTKAQITERLREADASQE
jgi:rRNA maturation protein Nop10